MAFCSFGGPGKENLCGVIELAKQESSMVPLLSCNVDMSSWLKDKYKGSGASGSRGRPADKGSGSGGKKCKIICCTLVYLTLHIFINKKCQYDIS